MVQVSLDQSEVAAQRRQHQIHEILILCDFCGDPIQGLDRRHELAVRQDMTIHRPTARQMWRSATGGEEMDRLDAPRVQPLGHLEGEQRAHTVAEERERPVEVSRELAQESIDQQIHRVDRGLQKPVLPAG